MVVTVPQELEVEATYDDPLLHICRYQTSAEYGCTHAGDHISYCGLHLDSMWIPPEEVPEEVQCIVCTHMAGEQDA